MGRLIRARKKERWNDKYAVTIVISGSNPTFFGGEKIIQKEKLGGC